MTFFEHYNKGENMRIRLGYVSISNTINLSPSKTITYTNFQKNNDYKTINNIIIINLKNLIEILKYNNSNNIHFYRLSSNIIPLATHKDVYFDYYEKYINYYNKISRIINDKDMRVDIHANNFCILNSINEKVVEYTIKNLEYYYNLFQYMNINNGIVIMHIGSTALGHEQSINRFINNYLKLPNYLKKIIAIENDDKSFNIKDIVYISKKLNVPIVLDYHHHLCNGKEYNIEDYMQDIINSWKNKNCNIKMHFSSPYNKKNYRKHNDYINAYEFRDFCELLKKYNKDIDIMLEAKEKDRSIFKLIRELKYITNYKFIDETSFEL